MRVERQKRKRELLALVLGPEQLARFYEEHETHDARISNYPAMVAGLTTTIETRETCETCQGTGFRLLSKRRRAEYKRRIASADNPNEVRAHMIEEAHCAACEGKGGHVVAKRVLDPDSMFVTIRCPGCRGIGEGRDGERCPYAGCLGGYVIPCTVRERGSTAKGRVARGGTTFDGDEYGASGLALGDPANAPTGDVSELLRTSAELDRVRRSSGLAAEALAAYHGTEGNRWASTKWGRIFALWPLTASGRRLAGEAARASKAGSGFLLLPIERLASVRQGESATTVPNIRWRALLRAADDEARQLHAEAMRVLMGGR